MITFQNCNNIIITKRSSYSSKDNNSKIESKTLNDLYKSKNVKKINYNNKFNKSTLSLTSVKINSKPKKIPSKKFINSHINKRSSNDITPIKKGKTEKIYKEANDIANKELMISNSTRLGLALNYSVFFYDIKKMKEEAINIAKNAFDDAMKILDNLEISKAKDTLLIIQMLKENLIFWCNEINNEFES